MIIKLTNISEYQKTKTYDRNHHNKDFFNQKLIIAIMEVAIAATIIITSMMTNGRNSIKRKEKRTSTKN